jgi:bifunctional non-homologous end joining protein LigD
LAQAQNGTSALSKGCSGLAFALTPLPARTLLKKAPPNIRFSEALSGAKEELLQVARQIHLEGLIAKRPASLYEAGRRSGAWVKVKLNQQQEFVVGGYTPPEGSRNYFGALLVGYHAPGGFLFAGRVGTGFSEKLLANLYEMLQKIKRPTCPFVNLPRAQSSKSPGPDLAVILVGSSPAHCRRIPRTPPQ